MKRFAICRCYFKKNIYLKEFDVHVNFTDTLNFRNEYAKVFPCENENSWNKVEEKVQQEIFRRREIVKHVQERRKIIQKMYAPFHQHIFQFSEEIFDPSFLTLHRTSLTSNSEDIPVQIEKHEGKIYSFPVLKNEFCDALVEEIKHYENSSVPKNPPNSMNRYGVNIDELGFESLITEIREMYLRPITRLLYPEWGGDSLNTHKAFVVTYRKGEDEDLGYHFDNAEVTLNIALNDAYDEGELFFGPMRSEDSSFRTGYEHVKGKGLLHRGQQMHGALPIAQGERYNLIIWMRSSKIRNELCPMCDKKPDLEEVQSGVGDGFTIEDTGEAETG